MRKHWKTVKCRKWDWQMNTHTICCYCIYRYLTRETMQNIPESLYVYSYWDGIFAWMDESTSWLNSENMPTLFFEEPLFIAHGSKPDNCCNLLTFNCHYQLLKVMQEMIHCGCRFWWWCSGEVDPLFSGDKSRLSLILFCVWSFKSPNPPTSSRFTTNITSLGIYHW